MNSGTRYSEEELITLLNERNHAAFGYLYDHYSGALYGVISQMIADAETANDVLQEVFINIWNKMHLYDVSKGRLFTWMLNIARNASIDKLRSKGFQNNRKNTELPADHDTSGAYTLPAVQDVGLKKMLTKLKIEHRTLIDLSYFQGFTHEEIAKMQDIPLGTVKTRIRTALSQLKNMIQ